MTGVLKHLMFLADDFLIWSSLNCTATFSLKPEPIQLRQIIRDRVEVVITPLANAKGILFCVTYDYKEDDGCETICDPTRLVQILVNLCSNAIQYTNARDGKVDLHVRCTVVDVYSLSIKFTVVDNGGGMSETDMLHVFEPFQRGVSGQSNSKGIGLGLVISKSLVEKMGGTILVHSQLGRGSTFEFELTLRRSENVVKKETEVVAASLPPVGQEKDLPFCFLVVDDNAFNQTLFVRTVEILFRQLKRSQPPPNYVFASNGLEAVAKFKQSLGSNSPFDCIFMDREMPLMDGVEATRLISMLQKDSFVKVLIIGLSASVQNMDDWKHAGMDLFLGKPFTRKDFLRILKKIDKRRLSVQNSMV
jgi:CheY-like chemotaxis protein